MSDKNAHDEAFEVSHYRARIRFRPDKDDEEWDGKAILRDNGKVLFLEFDEEKRNKIDHYALTLNRTGAGSFSGDIKVNQEKQGTVAGILYCEDDGSILPTGGQQSLFYGDWNQAWAENGTMVPWNRKVLIELEPTNS